MAFGLAEVNIDGKGLQGRERFGRAWKSLESKGMSKYPKLHSILRCRYRICKKLGSTVDGNRRSRG